MTPPPRRLDCTGLLCPLPVLKARKALLAMSPGAVLEVVATDPVAGIDLPHFCTTSGHLLLGVETVGDVRIFVIRRGPDRPSAGQGEAG